MHGGYFGVRAEGREGLYLLAGTIATSTFFTAAAVGEPSTLELCQHMSVTLSYFLVCQDPIFPTY